MFSLTVIFSLLISNPVNLFQSPSRQGWSQLAEKSTSIILGLAESENLVIRRDKINLKPSSVSKDKKTVQLPNPSDYIIGRIVRIRVNNLVKNNDRLSANSIINIFIPASSLTEGMPVFEAKQRYLIFLSPFKGKENEYATATIFQPNVAPKDEKAFRPADCFSVVDRSNGVERITPKNRDEINAVIKEIRASTNKPR
ncbi:MAG: hypothetical protein AB7P14_09590 [Blastocatellales bacterium]